MALTSDSDLQNKLTTLKRAPCPKPPIPQPGNQPEFLKKKLRPVSNPDTCKNTSKEAVSGNNNENNNFARKKSVKETAKRFNGQKDDPGGSPSKPPLPSKPPTTPKPHPVNGFKKTVPKQPPFKEQNSKSPQHIHRVIPDKPSQEIQAGYEDKRVPDLSPLPPTLTLGDPPKKPTKLWSLKKSLEKYIGTSHPLLPNTIRKPPENLEDVKRKPAMSLPTDAPPIPTKPVKTDVNSSHNQEKVGEKAVTVTTDGINEDSQGEDFYDDTTGMDISTGTQDETFGEDFYEPIATTEPQNTVETVEEENYEVLPAENESVPPALPPHTEKMTKEEKKKKEREEKERRKKDKEEKDKEEKERKKREKEKERKLGDMKRRFSVRGNETILGICIAAVDIQGNRMDISATIGEEFDVIRKDKTPTNKWLVRNKQSQCRVAYVFLWKMMCKMFCRNLI